jgi:hypothetical protein
MFLRARQFTANVLHQLSAQRDTEHLRPATDAQHRQPSAHSRSREPQLGLISIRLHLSAPPGVRRPVLPRLDVAAAAQQQPIHRCQVQPLAFGPDVQRLRFALPDGCTVLVVSALVRGVRNMDR